MLRIPRGLLVALSLTWGAGALRAQDAAAPTPEPASAYGDTYTPGELAALDRALHAGNMDREDLRFHRDMAKGVGCLPVVRAMLRDPLLIAPVMDRIADATAGTSPGFPAVARHLLVAQGLFADGVLEGQDLEAALDALARRLPAGAGAPPTTPAAALGVLEGVLRAQPGLRAPDDAAAPAAERDLRLQVLRRHLPDEMAMRKVFASPYDAAVEEAIAAHTKDRPQAYLHDLAGALDVDRLVADWFDAFHAVIDAAPRWPREAFPQDAPEVRETPWGRVALGTPGPDVYRGEYAAIVDPGGDDHYVGARVGASFGVEGRRVGLLLDLGGNDVYACGDVDATLGAALLGIAAFLDLGRGNDRYAGGHGSLGAAVGGVAVFYDDGGSDVYEGKSYTQGAAAYGIGLFLDDAGSAPPPVRTDEESTDPVDLAALDNDRLHAWVGAQGLARPRGVAFCVNRRGNEVYEAGGVHLHAPLFADRYQSFSQGFSIGSREVDHAGGVAMLIDRDGNDRYLGDVYDQGVGYWYAAGLLWDGGGHDVYEMTQYGQGSGIHLAVGGLVDVAGSDAYVMHSGLGQGGSHDFAASVLHDRGGDDRYHGNTSCNGCGLTNAVGLHLDRAGDDTYAARREGGWNAGRPARGFGSVGILLDLGGRDDHPGAARDGETWRSSDVGLGVDVPSLPPSDPASGGAPAADAGAGRAPVPAVCTYEGPLEAKVFDELWGIACRWEVGDNRHIVPKARARLVAFGKDVLPLLDARLEEDASGLELRAFVDVLAGLEKAGAREAVVDLLRRNAASPVERRQRVALHLVGELRAKELDEVVAGFVDRPDGAMARRAAAVLAVLGSHARDEALVAWLARTDDEPGVLAALGALTSLEADVYPALRPLLDRGRVSVRSRLATALAEHAGAYGPALTADVVAGTGLSPRALRTALDAFARSSAPPTEALVAAVAALLDHADWGVRADAARLVRRWEGTKDAPARAVAAARAALEARRGAETDPFVLSCGRAGP